MTGKWQWGGSARAGVTGLGLALFGLGCAKPTPCTNVITDDARSPNGRLKAVVFVRRCPDNGQRTTEISILRRDEALPDGNGNVYAGDGPVAVKVGWQTDTKLSVYSLADLTRAGTRLEKAGDIAVEYEQMMETTLLPPLDAPPSPPPAPEGDRR